MIVVADTSPILYLVLIDQIGLLQTRIEARRRHLVVTGTLGVLRTAAEQGLIDVQETLDRLKATNFYASDALITQMFERWTR